MSEQALSDWKSANEEIYSRFKEDLEGQLAQPYHQTILARLLKTSPDLLILPRQKSC